MTSHNFTRCLNYITGNLSCNICQDSRRHGKFTWYSVLTLSLRHKWKMWYLSENKHITGLCIKDWDIRRIVQTVNICPDKIIIIFFQWCLAIFFGFFSSHIFYNLTIFCIYLINIWCLFLTQWRNTFMT